MINKAIIFFSFILTTVNAWSQVFHFDQDSTALIKNVDQSPAHWYLEIFNDAGVDTTLRWKCHFENIPVQWNANFDDQNNFHATVNDGDSSDFTLFSGLTLPQKLIIGAAFNGTPGVGSYLYDIYDPHTPDNITTIEYHYIVGQAFLGENQVDLEVKRQGINVYFEESIIGKEMVICTFSGKTLFQGSAPQMLELPLTHEGLIYKVVDGRRTLVLKEIL